MSRFHLGKADVGETELRGLEVADRLVLVSRVEGKYRAIEDWCNHAGCLLSEGRREGRMVVCPCHEIGFDLATGKNLTSPDIAGDQPAFHIEEEDGELYVVLDSPAK